MTERNNERAANGLRTQESNYDYHDSDDENNVTKKQSNMLLDPSSNAAASGVNQPLMGGK